MPFLSVILVHVNNDLSSVWNPENTRERKKKTKAPFGNGKNWGKETKTEENDFLMFGLQWKI